MKNFNFKKISLSLLILSLAICSVFGFLFNKSSSINVNAEEVKQEIPSYFTVRQYTKYNEGQGAKPEDDIFVNIENGEVAYVSSSNKVEAKLYIPSEATNPIKAVTPFVKYNGQTINSVIINQYNIELVYNTSYFLLKSTFAGTNSKLSPYGKYEIKLEYIIETDEGIQENKSISYSYFIVKDSDYYNGKNVNTQILNSNLVEKDNISQIYDRIYQFNYTFEETNFLPTLNFNKKYINVEITKTFQKTTTKQKVWFDGQKVLTDNNLVYINVSTDDDTVSLVFNDLGSYAITYNFTYFKDNNVENINPAISIFTNIKRSDLIEIFGYQLFYSDSQTSNLKEFKEINEKGEIQTRSTDLSYMFTHFNTNIDNKQNIIINNKKVGEDSFSGILELLNTNKLQVQQTNQAPVQFKYNAEIMTDESNFETQSMLWTINKQLKQSDNKDTKPSYTYSISGNGKIYDNRPLSEAGIYLINVIYKYYPTVLGSDDLCDTSHITKDGPTEKLRSQWFLFEITKETAKVTVSDKKGHILPDEHFINDDVTIKKEESNTSIFNAETVLELYCQENYVGQKTKIATINSNEEFTATKNGKYEVKMLFGKNLTRSYSSTFTIDKDPIENIQIFAVNKYENSNQYYRTSEINFITNQSVSISWSNKASSSIITAQYKFVPLVYSNKNFDDSLLKQFYENYESVPVDYYFDFRLNKNYYIESDYLNTADQTTISPGNVLSQSGMYVFKVKDTAGNEKYFSFVIDKTPARILQKVKGKFVEPSPLNTLSSDVTVVWGKYKVVEFNNLKFVGGKFDLVDEWFNKVFNETDIYQNYFQMMTINTSNKFFIKSQIDNKVLMTTDGISGWLTNVDNCELKFLEQDTNQAAEHDYRFYIRDAVNTKLKPGYDAHSFENYIENYSATHRVKISSDSSLSELVYLKNGELTSLLQNSFNQVGEEKVGDIKFSKKDKYFEPTTIKTLTESNDILKFIFMPNPEDGVLEINEVSYKYTPFNETKHTDPKNRFAYTYSFFDYSKEEDNIVYSRTNPELNKTIPYSLMAGMQCWEINKEYNSITSSYQTKAGKYTITRTYANLNNTNSKVNSSHDFMIRTLTFIIDRNGILSSPVLTDSGTEKLYSYVGDSIKIQVLEDENDKMFFEDIFLASNNISSSTPILETNKLPVFVMIPTYKYGYSFVPGGSFHIEDSIGYYKIDEKEKSKINAFSLSAEIKYSKESSTIDQSSTIYRSYIDKNDGYLKFNGISSTSGRAFTNVGYYKVTIKQGIYEYGQNTFSFTFRIKTGTPSFTVNNIITNEELSQYNNNYYTNQEKVRLSWEDPESEFEAKINKDEIYYSVNNATKIKINSNTIKTINRLNTIDLDINAIGAYSHNSTINISMQFEGNEIDYSAGSFKKIKTIVIDTVAPQTNINKLVSLSGINKNLVRKEQTKYNTSVANGLYKYYSFCIDVSNIEQIIDFSSHLDGETYAIYYREFINPSNQESTKYNNIYQQETLPSEIENSTTNFTQIKSNLSLNDLKNNSNLRNKYIEIAEIDLAGNITVYTIYLTDVNILSDNIAINYKNNGIAKSIKYKDLKDTSIYAKSSFKFDTLQITDFAWNKITMNGVSYLKTPYSDNMYFNLSIYDETNPTKSTVALKEFGQRKPNAQIQPIVIELIPLYNKITLNVAVLNTSLSVIHTSSTELYSNEEGILIKIPASTIVEDAKIYATSVEINQYVKDINDKDVKQTLYKLKDDNFFASQQSSLSSPATIKLSYVIYMGSTYLKIKVTAPVSNRFYTYTVTDNFNDVYPFTSIYGSEKIDKELSSYVDVIQRYENGKLYYYSTKNTFFKYNSAKDKIKITVATTNYTSSYDFSKQEDIAKFNSSGYGRLTIPVKDSVVYTVEMYAPKLDMADGIVGSEYSFTIDKFTAIDEISTGISYDTINLILYNIVPNIYLTGTQNQSENELFNKGTMYGNAIKISFRHNIGRIPCIIYLQYEDGTVEQIASDTIVSKPAVYTLIIKYTDIFTDSQYDVYLDFTISDNDEEFYKVVYTENDKKVYAKQTGKPFSYVDGNKTYSVETHFIINTTDFNIIYNTEQGIEAIDTRSFTTGGFLTYFYTLSNQNSLTATSFFNRTIAITVIPKTNSILKHFSYYENEGNPKLLTGSLESFIVSKEESNIGYKRISWQSYYGIPENTIDVTIFFGDNQTVYNPIQTTDNNITSIQLTSSGTYYLQFKDKAGNFHMFTQSTGTYTIRYLRSVIYNVNGKSPINNAIYDSEVIVNVPTSTSKYYDPNAQPKLSALKNGEEYAPVTDRSNYTYTFNEPGLYKIWFSAAVTDKDGVVKEINEEPLYFLIINSKESRWSFEFSEYSSYYVKDIIRNGVNVTEKFTNKNIGNITYKQVEQNGQLVQKPYLKNFLISVNDIATGRGEYTVTIATDNEFEQEFTFNFWINNTTPSIKVSVEQNVETTDKITVSFNTIDLLEDVGDCRLSITSGTRSTILDLNQKALSAHEIEDTYNLKIEDAGTYYIQLFSESGKLLYSYRVIKKDPLNAVSIIVIVSVTLVTVSLAVVFIVLRKRMKIK